jgi:cation diffusion facilitator CzcD-associated flavoprotein CzcO
MQPDVDVLVIGAGFAGIAVCHALQQDARDFVIFEKASSVGGTWFHNTYPGCACDVPSHLYSLSFMPKSDWTRMFAPQAEIRAYLEDCAQKLGLLPKIRFNKTVTESRWLEDAALWEVRTADGEVTRARVVIAGMGPLHTPQIPPLEGLEQFGGVTFHSATWRHDVDLRGQRVAVIGTGASSIQFVPQIQPQVARLTLFQRSAAWVFPKNDFAFSPRVKALFAAFEPARLLFRGTIFASLEYRSKMYITRDAKLLEESRKMALAHLEAQVEDPALRAKLTPDYEPGCKRPLISDDFYPAVAQPNVEVVTSGIARVTPKGIVDADGVEHEVDVIIFGTGLKPGALRSKFIGRDGEDLSEQWNTKLSAHYGTTKPGFPNLFVIVGPNTGIINSIVYIIESQVAFIRRALRWLEDRRADAMDVRQEAYAAFNADLERRSAKTIWTSGCKSWYLSNDGTNGANWPQYARAYRREVIGQTPEMYAFVSSSKLPERTPQQQTASGS